MIRNKIYVFHFIVAAYSPATILLNKYSNEIQFLKHLLEMIFMRQLSEGKKEKPNLIHQ